MLEVIKDVCLSLVRDYGMFSSVLFTILLFCLIVYIKKNLNKILQKIVNFILMHNDIDFEKLIGQNQAKRLHITQQMFFYKLNHLFTVRVQQINCPCVLRQTLYKKIFSIKIKLFYDGLKSFFKQCQKQYDKDYCKLKITNFFQRKHLQWKQKCLQQKVPKFVIQAIDEKIQPLRDMYYINLQRVFDNNYLYSNNKQRLSAISDMFLSLQENILNVCQQVLDSFNGQIKNLQIDGITCKQCSICVHDQYLKKHNK